MHRQLRCWLWLPAQGSQRSASVVGLFLLALLGLAGAPRAPDFSKLMGYEADVGMVGAFLFFLFLAGQSLIWLRARADYLSDYYAAVPITTTHILLTGLFTANWSISLLCTGNAVFRLGSGEPIDWAYTLRCVAAAESGLVVLLFVSWLFGSAMSDEFKALCKSRSSALAGLKALKARDRVGDVTSLVTALQAVASNAASATNELCEAETKLASDWAKGARHASNKINGLNEQTVLVWDDEDEKQLMLLDKSHC